MKNRTRAVSLAAAALFLASSVASVVGQDPPANAGSAPQEAQAWPRIFEENGLKLTLYQPQVDRWDQTRLAARAAVAVETAASPEPHFGVVSLTAHTEVEKEERLVLLENIQIVSASFPSVPERADEFRAALAKHLPRSKVLDLDQLQASAAVVESRRTAKRVPLRNDPPRIFLSERPALLVLVDGKPVARRVPGTQLERIINTRSLLLQEERGGRWFLAAGAKWLVSDHLEGPWSLAPSAPAGAEQAKRTAGNLVELREDDLEVEKLLERGEAPTVFVSTTPAELVETQGPPAYDPIPGTNLLWATNTDADLIVDSSSSMSYLLLSGRWFRAISTKGPWEFIPARQLPADFARIPETEPAGEVLASIPGTPQAQEALIASQVPQTATVDRRKATVAVEYDGDPQFEPVDGTGFSYAINCATPVIEFGYQYYACHDGVWFVSQGPYGPWSVAVVVPAAIYTIPPSCPIHYVTYVRVYEATDDWVCFGYTPGYFGCCILDGCVVWGTGWWYRPWIGRYWFGCPWTYGFSVGIRWGSAWGWGVGLACGARPPCHPWWGPLARPHPAFYPAVVSGAQIHLNFGNANIYSSWPGGAVRTRSWPALSAVPRPAPGRPNDVYVSPDGHLFRHTNEGWQRREEGAWHPAPSASPEDRSRMSHLEAERRGREQGVQRSEGFRRGPGPTYEPPVRGPEPHGVQPHGEPPVRTERPSSPPVIPPGLRGGTIRGGGWGGGGTHGGGTHGGGGHR